MTKPKITIVLSVIVSSCVTLDPPKPAEPEYLELSKPPLSRKRDFRFQDGRHANGVSIKKRLTMSTDFKRFESARRTIYGAEVIRMLRKGQYDSDGSVRPSQFEIFNELAA